MHPRLLYLFLVILFTLNVQSQAQTIPIYTFSQTLGSYVGLSSANTLASGTGYDDERYQVALPFVFQFDNVAYNSVYIGMNGYISFGNTDPGSGYWMIASSGAGVRSVSGFDFNLGSFDTSTRLQYKTVGTMPNREFVAEWKNVGTLGTNVLKVNCQIRLNESDNSIKIMYGSISLNTGSNISVQIGLLGLTNSVYANRSGSGSAWNTTSNGPNSSSNFAYTGGSNPTNGQTYIVTIQLS